MDHIFVPLEQKILETLKKIAALKKLNQRLVEENNNLELQLAEKNYYIEKLQMKLLEVSKNSEQATGVVFENKEEIKSHIQAMISKLESYQQS